MSKRLYIFTTVTIALIITLFTTFCFVPNVKRVCAEEVPFLGYYEESVDKGEFDYSEIIEGEIAALKINSRTQDTSKIDVQGSKITISNVADALNGFLGANIVCSLTTDVKTYEFKFMYVTKAIRTAADCKVFNVTSDANIDGYYVLLEDIDLGTSAYNLHPGSGGFSGTFDGLGHTIKFAPSTGGFFGVIVAGAKILNTGFIYTFDANRDKIWTRTPVLARGCLILNDQSALIRDCFFYTTENELESGLITNGTHSAGLKIENIIAQQGTLNSFYYFDKENSIDLGAFIGHECAWRDPARELGFKNIYFITGHPLGAYTSISEYMSHNVEANPQLYTNGQYFWIKTFAANEGIEEDLERGIYVYDKVKKYISYASMLEDENDYTAFNSSYWDTSMGVPVWRKFAELSISFETEAVTSTDNINLVVGGADTVQFYFSMMGLRYNGNNELKLSYELLESYGKYTYQTDVVTVSDDLVVTAVKAGQARILVYCDYEGQRYEKCIKLTVKERNDLENSAPDNESGEASATDSNVEAGGSGCNASIQGNTYILVGIIALGVLHFLGRKRQKDEKQ